MNLEDQAAVAASIARAKAAGTPVEFISTGKGPVVKKDHAMTDHRLQAELGCLQAELKALRREISPQERDEMAQARHRHDSVAALFGESARDPIMGESSEDYRCALLQKLAPRTRSFKNSIFARLDRATLDVIEKKAHAEVAEGHRHDASGVRGKLIPIQTRDQSGRIITTYEGDICAFLAPFQATGMGVALNRKPGGENY